MKYVVILLLTLSLIGGTSWYGSQVGAWFMDLLKPGEDHSVPTLALRATEYSLLVPASGELVGFKTVPILTPRIRRGRLKIGWLADEGSIVEASEVIVSFDETETQMQLEQSQKKIQ